jgi:hypothetical protein
MDSCVDEAGESTDFVQFGDDCQPSEGDLLEGLAVCTPVDEGGPEAGMDCGQAVIP